MYVADRIRTAGVRPKIESDGIVTFVVPWGKEVTMGRAYFDSVATLDPLDGISRFSGPLLSVVGSDALEEAIGATKAWLAEQL